ncbi:hypothetical protein [Marinactinospora rubrisoli]|uniref:Uncharacterized protein n=1 Tax=Marinactinospora rubrisoli TaxID=2715399 RepID=A0ABW2KNE7_9ACTN
MSHRLDDAELAQAVDAAYGRLVRGAPPPAGSVTIDARDAHDFRRQWEELFGGRDGDEEPGAADHPGTPGAAADPGTGRD